MNNSNLIYFNFSKSSIHLIIAFKIHITDIEIDNNIKEKILKKYDENLKIYYLEDIYLKLINPKWNKYIV